MSKPRTKRPKKYSAQHSCTNSRIVGLSGKHIATCFSPRTANLIVSALNSQLNLRQARETMQEVIGSAS